MIEKRRKNPSNPYEDLNTHADNFEESDSSRRNKGHRSFTYIGLLGLSLVVVVVYLTYVKGMNFNQLFSVSSIRLNGDLSLPLKVNPITLNSASDASIAESKEADMTPISKEQIKNPIIVTPNVYTQMPYDSYAKRRIAVIAEDVQQKVETVRKLKHSGVVMETDPKAKEAIEALQHVLPSFLLMKYGAEPYRIEMVIQFPDSMKSDTSPIEETITFNLGPSNLVPYSIYYFLEVVDNWKTGAFHRNAGHVLQALARTKSKMSGLAFQEYHPDWPHAKYTLGYAGRPGGPEFYISTEDNTRNHGPGSQGSKTEADGCFGKITDEHSIQVVKRMQTQPGKGPMGFISSDKNFIKILSFKLIHG
eukprot:gene7744-10521_t